MAIKKTVAGTYAVDFRDQERRRILRTFDTYKAATDFYKDVQAQVAKREYVRPIKRTVKEVAEEWLEKKKQGAYERNTLIGWKVHIERYIVPSFGALLVQDLDVERIEQAAAAEWNEHVSAVTVNKILTTLAAVLSLAKRYKLIKSNPVDDVERLNVSSEEDNEEVTPDKVYTKEELKKLIEATEPGTLERVIVMFPALTGIRVGELTGATWEAIDLKAGSFEVKLNMQDNDKGQEKILKAPKSRSGRRVLPLSRELTQELRLWKLKCPQSERGLVVVNVLGKPFHRKQISNVLDTAIEKAKVKRLTPHGLRHTFCSLLIADGIPVTEVAHYAGHKDPSVTLKVYAHFVPRETAAMHNLAASILGATQ
jgi:integrase